MKPLSGEHEAVSSRTPISDSILFGDARGVHVIPAEIGRMPIFGVEGKEIVVQIVEAPPGAISERHFHHGEEFYYILEGAGIELPGKPPQNRATGSYGANQREVPHAGYRIIGDKDTEDDRFLRCR
jgi:quercetin dioxygenase-like cupin family protein